jgi:hypothetical protein
MGGVFTIEERDRVRDHILAKAFADPRIVAGAEVGSLALGGGDRWSDLDLTFGLRDGVGVDEVLDEWTRELGEELDAVHLFDLPSPPAIYRVFLLPRLLQVDVSFAPASKFYPRSPRFRLLFGEAGAPVLATPPSAEHLFGMAVHHALRARFYIEREGYWKAEYWISQLRDYVLALACLRLGLPTSYARGFDDLPADEREPLRDALVRSLERDELLRALVHGITGLLREARGLGDVSTKVEPLLRSLTDADL